MVLNKQVDIDHYNFQSYVTKERWISYWHQIDEVCAVKPKNVLIIGIGDGIVVDILKRLCINVYTFDIDENLKPDYVGSVTDIINIVGNRKFDCILCCQVLEHIPFKHFEAVVRQLCELTVKSVIISLPYCHIKAEMSISMPKIRLPKLIFTLPKTYKRWKFNGEHYWELGTYGYHISNILKIFKKYFIIKKYYKVPENTYHIFFILSKAMLDNT